MLEGRGAGGFYQCGRADTVIPMFRIIISGHGWLRRAGSHLLDWISGGLIINADMYRSVSGY